MKGRITYWVITALFAMMMAGSAFAYLSGDPTMVETFRHLGYPDYFRVLLGLAKVIGVLALVAPFVPRVLREWAYAGFVFTLVAAAISHAASHDAAGHIAGAIVALGMVGASYALQRYRNVATPAANQSASVA